MDNEVAKENFEMLIRAGKEVAQTLERELPELLERFKKELEKEKEAFKIKSNKSIKELVTDAKKEASDALVEAKKMGCIDEKTMNQMAAKLSELSHAKSATELTQNITGMVAIKANCKEMVRERSLNVNKNRASLNLTCMMHQYNKASMHPEFNGLKANPLVLKIKSEYEKAKEQYKREISGTGIRAQITHEGSELGDMARVR